MKKSIFCVVFFLIIIISTHSQSLGDVNSDSNIDIVDALLIAQYYVGLNPQNFNQSAADVNCSNTVDIVDALLISQYYVGLIGQFPCDPTAPPTEVPTQAPTTQPGITIPGTLEAEDYVSFYDTTAGNEGGVYRTDDVDIEDCSEGGYNVGWIASGEWLSFNINVQNSGTYTVEVRVASETGNPSLHIDIDGNSFSGSISTGSTGGFQIWTSVYGEGYLSSGNHTLTVHMDADSFNVNRLTFTQGSAPTPSPTQVPTATPAVTDPPTGDWQLVWSDEFNGSGLPNQSDWWINQWDPGTVNDEAQKYTNRTENIRQENGSLVIEARNDNWNGYSITSGRIESNPRWAPDGSTSYRIEARIKMPSGGGTWPAFWLLGDESGAYGGWPDCGEIDIVEYVGNNPNWYHSAIHVNAAINMAVGGTTVSGSETSFHVSAAELYNDRVEFYADGNHYMTYKPSSVNWSTFPFNNPSGNGMRIILNMAIGGMMGGSINYGDFPFYLYVDYVRVYRK